MRYLALSALAVTTAAAQIPDYFPLHVGNEWVYRESFLRTSNTLVVGITGTETIGGRVYSLLSGLPEGPLLLRSSGDGTLVRYDRASRQEQVWAEFATPEGGTYRTGVDGCSPTARMESRDASLELPAGNFTRALRIAYPSANCADAGLTHEVFAPYIGLIQRGSLTIAGPRRLDLVYARVGGVTVLSEPELSMTLALDKAVYRRGQVLNGRLTLRSTHPEPVELNFRSGQRFDMAIRNEKGEHVYQWSATRVFPAVLGTEKIGPGQRTWTIDAPLDLPPGRYVAEAWIADELAKRFGATVGFSISAE